MLRFTQGTRHLGLFDSGYDGSSGYQPFGLVNNRKYLRNRPKSIGPHFSKLIDYDFKAVEFFKNSFRKRGAIGEVFHSLSMMRRNKFVKFVLTKVLLGESKLLSFPNEFSESFEKEH